MESTGGILKMDISAEVEQKLIEFFNLEQEALNATVEYLPNNLKRITIQVPAHKSALVREFILRSISNIRKENLN